MIGQLCRKHHHNHPTTMTTALQLLDSMELFGTTTDEDLKAWTGEFREMPEMQEILQKTEPIDSQTRAIWTNSELSADEKTPLIAKIHAVTQPAWDRYNELMLQWMLFHGK